MRIPTYKGITCLIKKKIHSAINIFVKESATLLEKEISAKKAYLTKKSSASNTPYYFAGGIGISVLASIPVLVITGSTAGLLGGLLFGATLMMSIIFDTISSNNTDKKSHQFELEQLQKNKYKELYLVLSGDNFYATDENNNQLRLSINYHDMFRKYLSHINIKQTIFATLLSRLNLVDESKFLTDDSTFKEGNLIVYADMQEAYVFSSQFLENTLSSDCIDAFNFSCKEAQSISVVYTQLIRADKNHVLKIQNDIISELLPLLIKHQDFILFYTKYLFVSLLIANNIELTVENIKEVLHTFKKSKFDCLVDVSFDEYTEIYNLIIGNNISETEMKPSKETVSVESTQINELMLSRIDKELLNELDNLRHNESMITQIDQLKENVIKTLVNQSEKDQLLEKQIQLSKIENYFKEKNYIS